MKARQLLMLLIPLSLAAYTLIPLGIKYLSVPSYAPSGYHVEFDNKKEIGRQVTLKDSANHQILLYNTTEIINECNGTLRNLGGIQVCWQVELSSKNKSLITWKKNNYMYVLSSDDDLTQDEVANLVKNFN